MPQQDEPYLILFLMLRIAQTTIIAKPKITIAVPIKNSVNEIPTPELVFEFGMTDLFNDFPHDSHIFKATFWHTGIAVRFSFSVRAAGAGCAVPGTNRCRLFARREQSLIFRIRGCNAADNFGAFQKIDFAQNVVGSCS